MHSHKVAGGIIETHSLPTLTRSYPRRFTFYVAEPLSSILFLFGVQMLFGKMDAKTERSPEEGRDLAVFPLAVPSIAGPGAMMAVIVLTDNDVYTVPQRIETGIVLLVVLFLTYLLLLFSDAILRVIGRQGASVLVRVMGLILCSLAVEIVLTALGVGGWTTTAPR
jgi:multiple antibiotic resistance protein